MGESAVWGVYLLKLSRAKSRTSAETQINTTWLGKMTHRSFTFNNRNFWITVWLNNWENNLYNFNSPSISTTVLGMTFSTSQLVWRAGLQLISNSQTYLSPWRHIYSIKHEQQHSLIQICNYKSNFLTLKSASTMKSQPIRLKKPSRRSNLDLTANKQWVMICCMCFWWMEKSMIH